MLDFIRNLFHALSNVLQSIRFIDIVDIFLLTYLIYALLKMIRETRAGQLLKGILLLVIAFLVSDFIGLRAISLILGELLSVGMLALVILFQPELRRTLEKFGQSANRLSRLNPFTQDNNAQEKWQRAIPIICNSAAELSRTCTGALIVIERRTQLGEHLANGTILNALPSTELFGNIFYPKTPLHDGAVIMRDGMILAAACFLPKPQREELIDKHLGSRHRAAIGMSENSDAIIIVVSEETGQISVAQDGKLTRDYTAATLGEFLTSQLISEDTDTSWRTLFRERGKKVPSEQEEGPDHE